MLGVLLPYELWPEIIQPTSSRRSGNAAGQGAKRVQNFAKELQKRGRWPRFTGAAIGYNYKSVAIAVTVRTRMP
jgi:hypothetical protein